MEGIVCKQPDQPETGDSLLTLPQRRLDEVFHFWSCDCGPRQSHLSPLFLEAYKPPPDEGVLKKEDKPEAA